MKTKGVKIFLAIAVMLLNAVGVKTHVHAADVTLKNDKWKSGVITEKEFQYFKIKVPTTGYIKIQCLSDSKLGIHLDVYDSSKKYTQDTHIYHKDPIDYVGVKKGTYYLRLNCYDKEIHYHIKYTFKAVKKESVVNKKSISGLIITDDRFDDAVFRKLTVSKKTKANMKYALYGLNMNIFTRDDDDRLPYYVNKNGKVFLKDKGQIWTYFRGKGTHKLILNKGTYYLGFFGDYGTSGYYNIKLQEM